MIDLLQFIFRELARLIEYPKMRIVANEEAEDMKLSAEDGRQFESQLR